MAGGASVAYVFLHLLPELAEGQEMLTKNLSLPLAFVEHHIYLLALLGLSVFGLDRLAKGSQGRMRTLTITGSAMKFSGCTWSPFHSKTSWSGICSCSAKDRSTVGLFLFVTAMALHFLVNDYGLKNDHEEMY